MVLMDLEMPVMRGEQATERVRAMEAPSGELAGFTPLPIVALTAFELHSVEMQCRAVGFDAFLTKPLLRETLTEVMEQYMAHVYSRDDDDGEDDVGHAAAAAGVDDAAVHTALAALHAIEARAPAE